MRKPYPLYKDGGVECIGQIPETWKMKKLKYTIKGIITGIWGNEPADDDNDLKCIRVNDFDYEKLSVKKNEFTTRNIIFNGDKGQSVLQKNDLLIEKSGGGEKTPVGRVVIYNNELKEKSVCSNFIAVLRSELDKYDPKFLVYLHSKLYAEKINTRSIKQTTGIQNLDISSYLSEIIAIPNIIEQQQIVSFLDNRTSHIEDLIEKTKQKIELLKEKRTSLINYCVTKGLNPNIEMKDSGVEWIGEIPVHWVIKRLKYLGEVYSSTVDRHIYKDELQVSVCHYPDVYNNEFINENIGLNKGSCSNAEFEKFPLKEGLVIITKDSESPDDIGIPCYVETNLNNVVCGYHLSIIENNKNYINSKFLFRFIQSDIVRCHFEVHSKGITRFSLGKSIIENLFVNLPSISEQQQIVEYLDEQTQKIDALIEKENKRIELLKEYRQSLISEVVTGKIDVRDEVAV